MVGRQVDTASPDARQEPQPDSYAAPATDPPQLTSGEAFRTWYWLGVPLLAILAYATSLRVGFLADDFVLLFEGQHDVNLQTLLPPPAWTFYRPVGNLIIWILGARLWGYSPLPYHIIGLLVHAGVALVLGLWLAEATGKRRLGWLAGALFGVFPLHTEAVGWLAAQWDAWAVLFGLISLWCFTRWWRRGALNARLYMAALFLYALGLFTKESMLGWLPMLAVAAWFVGPRMQWKQWRKLALFLLPFVGLLALNLGLRWAAWHSIGGYPGARTDFANFFWDGFITYGRILLAPVNTSVLGIATQQVVGAVASLLLVAGLIAYGRRQLRLLIAATCWLAFALVPVLSLSFNTRDLNNSRFMYLAAAGYCVGVAALLYPALTLPGRARLLSLLLLGAGFALSIAACWVQLRPWHTATVQAEDVGQELHRVLPAAQHPSGLVWYVENVPDTYQGAYVLIQGLDRLRYFLDGEFVQFKRTDSAAQVDVANDPRGRDVFAMRYYFDPAENRYHLNYLSGFTSGSPVPSGNEGGQSLSVWDFRSCAADVVSKWRAANTRPRCDKGGAGLLLPAGSVDPQLIGPRLDLGARSAGARFVRLRLEASYPKGETTAHVAQWYWHGSGDSWSEQRSVTVPIRSDGLPHVYWTYLPVAQVGDITGLRFDPVDGQISSSVQWIAVDSVK